MVKKTLNNIRGTWQGVVGRCLQTIHKHFAEQADNESCALQCLQFVLDEVPAAAVPVE